MTRLIPTKSGIYKLICLITKKFYIGGAVNLQHRYHKHLSELRRNHHHSIHLQRAFNKYTEKEFKFEILELVDIDNLIEKEQYYLDLLKPYNFKIGYNISKFADLRKYNLGKPMSEEQKKKISISCKKSPAMKLRRQASSEARSLAQIKSNGVNYKLISPNGEIYEGRGVSVFCRKHNLHEAAVKRVVKGIQKTTNGWRLYE